jgi:hypothetical protein
MGSRRTCCNHHASPRSSHRHWEIAPLRDVEGIEWERDRTRTSVWGSSAAIGCTLGWFLSFLQGTFRLIVIFQASTIKFQRQTDDRYTLSMLLHVLKINQCPVDPRPASATLAAAADIAGLPIATDSATTCVCPSHVVYRHDTWKRYRGKIVLSLPMHSAWLTPYGLKPRERAE